MTSVASARKIEDSHAEAIVALTLWTPSTPFAYPQVISHRFVYFRVIESPHFSRSTPFLKRVRFPAAPTKTRAFVRTVGSLHETPFDKLRLDGAPTPRAWVARMTKRPTPAGAGQERLPWGGTEIGSLHVRVCLGSFGHR